MQIFLKSLQRQVRTTFLFVTHDQEEATTMSDRIVVMNVGRIEQIGTPKEIYYRPRSRFVAGFFGESNLIEGTVTSGGLVTPFGTIPTSAQLAAGTAAVAAVRPEKLRLEGPAIAGDIVFRAAVQDVVVVGAITQVLLRPDVAPAMLVSAKLASGTGSSDLSPGAAVEVRFGPADVAVVPAGASDEP